MCHPFCYSPFIIPFYVYRLQQYDSVLYTANKKTKNVFNTSVLRCELAFQLNVQMIYGKPGCVKKHPRPAVAHDFLYLPSSFRRIAVRLAGTAKCLVCHMRTVLGALAYIVGQLLARRTEPFLRMMVAAAVYVYHERHGVPLMLPLFFYRNSCHQTTS